MNEGQITDTNTAATAKYQIVFIDNNKELTNSKTFFKSA